MSEINYNWFTKDDCGFETDDGFITLKDAFKQKTHVYITKQYNLEDLIDHIYANVDKKTIVVKWNTGKTIKVKLEDGDEWDLEAGVNAAIVKYLAKSHNSWKKFIMNNTTYCEPHKNNEKSK